MIVLLDQTHASSCEFRQVGPSPTITDTKPVDRTMLPAFPRRSSGGIPGEIHRRRGSASSYCFPWIMAKIAGASTTPLMDAGRLHVLGGSGLSVMGLIHGVFGCVPDRSGGLGDVVRCSSRGLLSVFRRVTVPQVGDRLMYAAGWHISLDSALCMRPVGCAERSPKRWTS